MTNNKKKKDHYNGKTNIPDYGVPAGVQLTENLNEEIAEGAGRKLPQNLPKGRR